MATSINIDTISGRADFLKQRLRVLIWNSGHGRYESDVQAAIDRYKTLYYDRPLHEWQAMSVLKPLLFDEHYFEAKCLYSGYAKYHQKQFEEIADLKQQTAIRNRYENLYKVFSEFKSGFEKVWDSADANRFKLENQKGIERIEAEILAGAPA